ncbi:spore germination protein [Bacillus taeanensis]|uniref:Spore germination protein n=1 Tax=Bacillus taeanensis TaxID=273032 RepID=A0A366XX83_9BACI|nr:spore germination protein [Bacillus taeanensis]RBW69765.1 spore germination protein [Bacillus taeanensis]
MPSIVVGPFQFVTNDGTVNFGDTLQISPKSTSKSIAGSGGGTGNLVIINNGISISNGIDPDIADSNTAANV